VDEKERIAKLEAEVAYLRREKSVAVSALETAAALGHFHTSLSRLSSMTPLLEETASKVRSLIRCKLVAIYLVSEKDSDFVLAYADPEESRDYVEQEVAALIDQRTFSWALQRDKPLVVSSSDKREELLLHSISTASRARGMLVCTLEQEKKDILDTSYALLSIILLSSASILESFELYRYINGINVELKEHVAKLAESERKLLEHRNRLEEEVAERTRDLTQANHQLKREIAERRRTQRELVSERDFIAAVLDIAGALVVVLDAKGRVLRFNRACEQLSGYQASEVAGRTFWELFIPRDEREEVLNIFNKLKGGSFPNTYEGHWITRDGARRFITWSNSAIVDQHGQVAYIIGTGIDNTEKRSAESALRDSEARFRAVFMMAGIGIVLHDMQGRFLDCNPMFLNMLGYSRHELFQLDLRSIMHPEDWEKKEYTNKHLLDGTHVNMSVERRYLRKDGALRLGKTTMTLVRNHLREPQYFVELVEDVTEPRKIQDALRRAEQTYRNIFENAVEGIFLASTQGRLFKANPAMARILGFEGPQELLADDTSARLTTVDPENREAFLDTLREMGAATNYEMQVFRGDRRKIWVSISAWTAHGSEDGMRHIEGLMEDVTERKLSEMQLQQKATMDELTGVPNRYLFLERLEQSIAQAERSPQHFALLYIDLDNFKEVNDLHGHHVGDILLAEAASRIRTRIRTSDTPARIGGDEFTVLLHNVNKDKHIQRIASDLVEVIKQPYVVSGIRCVIGASIGVSVYPEDGVTGEQLLRHADRAMYRAKQQGGNDFYLYAAIRKEEQENQADAPEN